jgi:hypothetical protein
MWRAPLFLLLVAGLAQAQTPEPPRLVVVIAIDQFRGDFLQRYQQHFVAGGFNLKVVTIAGKDRSAIMLGGHAANAAYWMEDTLFVTSRYYRQDLPSWVRDFNRSGKITSYFGKTWDVLLPASVYTRYGPDDQPGERNEFGLGRTFPHVLGVGETRPGRQYIGALERSPFQNELVTAFAILYLNEPLIAARRIALAEAEAVAERAIEEIGGIFAAHTRADLARALQNGARTDVVLNFDARRSGSITYTTNPYVLVEEGELGSDHGASPHRAAVGRARPCARGDSPLT